MLKTSITLATLVAISAPVQANPVCYMETSSGATVDLSYMCGSGGSSSVAAIDLPLIAPQRTPVIGADVWTRNIHFSNIQVINGRRVATSRIVGNVHNSGTVMAENVELEAIGYAEGRTPQTRRVTIPRIGSDNAEAVAIAFDFEVPVDTWDVKVVGWE